MKIVISKIGLAVMLMCTVRPFATAQGVPAITISGGRTFLAGQIELSGDISSLDNGAFICTLIQPLKKGDVIAAMVSEDQAWSIDKKPLLIGSHNISYPILAMMKCSDGRHHSVFPVTLKIKVDIKRGEVVHSDGYVIEVNRPVKHGDSIPAVFVDGSVVLSVDPYGEVGPGTETRPWFTAFPERTEVESCIAAVEAWRIENNRIRGVSGTKPETTTENKEPHAAESLIAALNDSISIVRRNAAVELGKTKDASAVEPLVAALKDADFDVRLQSVISLATLKDARSLDPLALLKDDPDAGVRNAAAFALADQMDSRSIGPLGLLLKDPDADTRLKAVNALATFKDPLTVEPLASVVGDSDLRVRSAAAFALADQKDARAIDPLATVLKDTSTDARLKAVKALATFKNQRSLDSLAFVFGDSDARIHSAAVFALADQKDLRSVEPLIVMLRDPDGAVRLKAVSALGFLADKSATQPLVALLSDSDAAVRTASIASIGELNHKAGATPLIKLLHDPDPIVRGLAVSALGQLKATAAAKSLAYTLKIEPNADVKSRILAALSQITGKQFTTYAQWDAYLNPKKPAGTH